ncbi:hypothetical protein IBA8402_33070 [Pseudomonas syringae]
MRIEAHANRADRGKHPDGGFLTSIGAVMHRHSDNDLIDAYGTAEIGADHSDQYMSHGQVAFAGKLRKRVVKRAGQHGLNLVTGSWTVGYACLEIRSALQQNRRQLGVGLLPEQSITLVARRRHVGLVFFKEREVRRPLSKRLLAFQQA